MPSQVGQMRKFGERKDEKNVKGLLMFDITPIHWMISIFSLDFLRGNGFRLKTSCEFHVWPLCCGFREF